VLKACVAGVTERGRGGDTEEGKMRRGVNGRG